MPRVHYVTYLTDQYGQGVTGATVTVLPRNAATPAAVYQFSTGNQTLATPLTTLAGKAEFWLDGPTAYNITSSGTGFQDFTHYFDAAPAETLSALQLQFSQILAGNYLIPATSVGNFTIHNRLGIGTATPFTRLGVYATAANLNTDNVLFPIANSSNTALFDTNSSVFSDSSVIGFQNGRAQFGWSGFHGAASIVTSDNGKGLVFSRGNLAIPDFRILAATGNVGISTSTPVARLDVNGIIKSNQNFLVQPAATKGVVFQTKLTTDAFPRFQILADGTQQYGAGTAAPVSVATPTASGTYFSVTDYGAKGDGVTNDAPFIQAAIEAADRAGGGTVVLPSQATAAFSLATPLILKSKIHLLGSGVEASTLKLANGANCDLIVSAGFQQVSTRFGNAGTSNAGIYDFSIRNMTLDGNAQNNTAGWGMSLYGSAFFLEEFIIRYCGSGGLWAEYSNTNSPNGPNFEEAYMHNFRVFGNRGTGIMWDGPHDSMWTNGIVYENSNPLNGGVSWTADGIYIGPKGNALVASQVHSWGSNQRYGWTIAGDTVKCVNCTAEGASGGAQINCRANKFEWNSGNIYKNIKNTGTLAATWTVGHGNNISLTSTPSLSSGLLYFPTIGTSVNYTGIAAAANSYTLTGVTVTNTAGQTSIPNGTTWGNTGAGVLIGIPNLLATPLPTYNQLQIDSKIATMDNGVVFQGTVDGGSNTIRAQGSNVTTILPATVDNAAVTQIRNNTTRLNVSGSGGDSTSQVALQVGASTKGFILWDGAGAAPVVYDSLNKEWQFEDALVRFSSKAALPPAPGSGRMKLFGIDDGVRRGGAASGIMSLAAKWSDGTVQPIAVQGSGATSPEALGVYRTIDGAYRGTIFSGTSAAGYLLPIVGQNTLGVSSGLLGGGSATVRDFAFWFDPADFAVSGYTTKLRLRGVTSHGNNSSGVSGTFAMYPVATISASGSGNAYVASIGSIVTGSSVAIANSSTTNASVTTSIEFTAPATAGHYVLVYNSGNMGGTSNLMAFANLMTRSV